MEDKTSKREEEYMKKDKDEKVFESPHRSTKDTE